MSGTWLPDPKVTPPMPRPRKRSHSQSLCWPEKYLMVGLTPDEREIVVNYPDKADASGWGHLVFSAAQARHLAKLLLRKADECVP
jgi:hypothetical protein